MKIPAQRRNLLSQKEHPINLILKELRQTPSHQAGEKFILQQDGQDAVEFSIDKVEVTEERSEFDPSNPEKVVVITYTYKNLLMGRSWSRSIR